ncbi:O-antigen ligase family protein (plasmid) [Bacillus tropicus]|uniref:O-antigen ligase family protein n=1 Tax=Bacillus tropicus TaxID=2026188 RepID=UPI0022DD39C8|nr:O-antigen ligase family protein [Bacillus tropicus]WBO93068.1 O-antigen ligase family protein [Bacillus tropicus]
MNFTNGNIDKNNTIISFALIGIIVGVLSAINYFYLILSCIFILITLFVIKNPDRYGYFILFMAAFSIQYIFPIFLGPLDMASLYKVLLLSCVFLSIIRFGLMVNQIYVLLSFFIVLVNSFLFSSLPSSLSYIDTIKAFVGLVAPWALLLIKWPLHICRMNLKLICSLPIISSIVGILLTLSGIYSFYFYEYTGVVRFQGSSIPAHLAMLSYIGFMVSLIEAKRNKGIYYLFSIINFLILLSTGTRGPLLASIIIIFVYLLDNVKAFISGKIQYLFYLIIFTSVIFILFILKKDSFLARTKQQGEGAFNLSGREEAWQYFLHKAHDSSIFGKGLGSILQANDGSIFAGFVVPHNEYIRFYYEMGYVGTILIFLTFFYLFRVIYNVIDKKIKLYYVAFIIGVLIYSFSDNIFSTVQFTVPFCWYLSTIYSISKQQ